MTRNSSISNKFTTANLERGGVTYSRHLYGLEVYGILYTGAVHSVSGAVHSVYCACLLWAFVKFYVNPSFLFGY